MVRFFVCIGSARVSSVSVSKLTLIGLTLATSVLTLSGNNSIGYSQQIRIIQELKRPENLENCTGLEEENFQMLVRVFQQMDFGTDYLSNKQLENHFDITSSQSTVMRRKVKENLARVRKMKELEKMEADHVKKLSLMEEGDQKNFRQFQFLLRCYHFFDQESDQSYRQYSKTLNRLQRKSLKAFSTYRATLLIFSMRKRISDLSEADQYLEWPEWIAEEIGLGDSVVKKLKERRLRIEKKIGDQITRSKVPEIQTLLQSKPDEPIDPVQKNIVRNLKPFVDFQKTYQRFAVLGRIPKEESFQQDLEISPSQLEKISKIKFDWVRRRLNGSKTWTMHFGSNEQLKQLSNELTKHQQKKIDSIVQENIYQAAVGKMHPWHRVLVTACLEDYASAQRERIYANIVNSIEQSYDRENDLIKNGLKKILVGMPPSQKTKIRRYLGRRYSRLNALARYERTMENRFSKSPFPEYKVLQTVAQ